MALGAFSATLDGSILSVALPSIIKDLNCDLGTGQFIISSYTFTICGLLLIFGSLSDSLGRKRLFSFGIALFSLSCLLAALAPNAILLICFRILQGIGAAMYMANGMALVNSHFSNKFRGRAFGMMSTAIAIASILGPSIGGLISSLSGWRSVFLALAPAAIIAAFLAVKLLNKEKIKEFSIVKRNFDYKGAVLSFILAISLVGTLLSINNQYWIFFAVLITATITSSYLFMRTERSSPNAIIPIRLLGNQTFVSSNVMALLLYIIMMGLSVIIPFQITTQSGGSSAIAGLLLSIMAVPVLVISYAAGFIADKRSAKIVVLSGLITVLLGITILVISFQLNSILVSGLGVLIFGIGVGLFNPSNNKIVMASVAMEDSSMAASVNTLFRNFGNGMGISLAGIIYGAILENANSSVSPGVGSLVLLLIIALILVAIGTKAANRKNKED